ncbi:MAG: phosphatase PAP2 family protein [Sedimentisphaerales bacterium]|jgi:undecaprenyl-diphosphatase|nr:phosphatase PAP2 family protein [Sedimentisphaerales bacterium]
MARYPRRNEGPLFLVIILALLAVISLICWLWVDRPLAYWLSRQDRSWYNHGLVTAIVQLGKGRVLAWFISLAVAYKGIRPGVVAAVISLIVAGMMVGPLKPIVGRVRPAAAIAASRGASTNISGSQRHSFPSGDAAAAFAVASTLCGLVAGWKAIGLIVIATAVACLRVISLNHYPSDVIAGAAIGLVSGIVGLRIARAWYLPDRRHQGTAVRMIGAAAVVLITAGSFLFQGKGPMLAFLIYLGPIVCIWLVWDALGRRFR